MSSGAIRVVSLPAKHLSLERTRHPETTADRWDQATAILAVARRRRHDKLLGSANLSRAEKPTNILVYERTRR